MNRVRINNDLIVVSQVIDSGLLDNITSEEKKLQEAMFEVRRCYTRSLIFLLLIFSF